MRRVTKATDPQYIQDLYTLYEKSFHISFSRKPENCKSKFRADLAAKISECPSPPLPRISAGTHRLPFANKQRRLTAAMVNVMRFRLFLR